MTDDTETLAYWCERFNDQYSPEEPGLKVTPVEYGQISNMLWFHRRVVDPETGERELLWSDRESGLLIFEGYPLEIVDE